MKKAVIVFFLFIFILAGKNLFAFETEEDRLKEQGYRTDLRKTENLILQGEGPCLFKFGGWLTSDYTQYHDDDNDSAVGDSPDYSFYDDLRLWAKLTFVDYSAGEIKQGNSIYARIRHRYNNWQRFATDREDHDGVHIDMLYGNVKFDSIEYNVGRRYFSLGRGIAYADVHDGIEIKSENKDFSIKAFVSHTLHNEDNIDTSVPGFSDMNDRTFYGVEYTSYIIPNHELYIYGLIQNDKGKENPENASGFEYDSQYFGTGSKGEVMLNMRYWTESILQIGESYSSASNTTEDISASAFIFGTSYNWPIKRHPVLTFEYAYGSGDNDRANVTNTTNGNLQRDDNNFLYFGGFASGFALTPRLSNIHIYKFGGSIKPFEGNKRLENLTLGTNFYYYQKSKDSGGISDLQATDTSNDLGKEIDLYLYWRIFSDMSFTIKYGYFKPGDAFPSNNDDSEVYLNTSITLTF